MPRADSTSGLRPPCGSPIGTMPSALDRRRPHRALDLVLRVSCALLIAAAFLGGAAAKRAAAYEVETPLADCLFSGAAEKATLEAAMSPSDGATIQVGQSVEFSGRANTPLSFAIASSVAQLANPDIASGVGTPQSSGQPGEPPTQTFSSAAVTQTARPVYWEASFQEPARPLPKPGPPPEPTLPECGLPRTITTTVRSLVVAPAPMPTVSTPPPVESEEPRCSVPALRGDSLARARKAIIRAHCSLGAVKHPHGTDGGMVVVGQSPSPARSLAGGGRVELTLGPRPHGKRHTKKKRTTGVEPATSSLGSLRSTN